MLLHEIELLLDTKMVLKRHPKSYDIYTARLDWYRYASKHQNQRRVVEFDREPFEAAHQLIFNIALGGIIDERDGRCFIVPESMLNLDPRIKTYCPAASDNHMALSYNIIHGYCEVCVSNANVQKARYANPKNVRLTLADLDIDMGAL